MDNRILVAAARGARLQYREPHWYVNAWHETASHQPATPFSEWRVHPDDTELLYCTVGRALRESAKHPPILLTDAADIDTPSSPLAQFNPYASDWLAYKEVDTETRRMFLLMLAEELSYEVLE